MTICLKKKKKKKGKIMAGDQTPNLINQCYDNDNNNNNDNYNDNECELEERMRMIMNEPTIARN